MYYFFLRYALVFWMIVSCASGLLDDPIPVAVFDDIIIQLDFPEYIELRQDGGFIEITGSNAGIRGIIVYRKNQNTYLAYEKNCSYKPLSACATVYVHASGLYMVDDCCESSFSFSDGKPFSGPARRSLKRYTTYLSASQLTIED